MNYIDNLLLKINQGTAAIPAYSNEIDTQLSMFYYQSPNVLEDFKSFMLTQQDPVDGKPALRELFEKIVFQVHGDKARYNPAEQAEQFKRIPAHVVLKLANREGLYGFGIFAQQSEHIGKITSRIQSSKIAIKEFQEFAEHAAKAEELGEDVGYMGTDLIEDFLSAFSNVFSNVEFIDERRYPNAIKIQNLAENELYDAMASGDLRKAYRLTRKLMRMVLRSQMHKAKDFLLGFLQKILDYTDKFRFGPEKHIPKLVRSIRASMEGFQTLFENNRRNKMKLTRRRLRNLIMETLDASALDLEITPQIAEMLEHARVELERSGHPMPHVVLNSIMVDLQKGHPGELAYQVVNRH